jgi:hypothetical protein
MGGACSTRRSNKKYIILCGISERSRSQWPRGLRGRSAAARLPGLWLLIPPRAWMFVCCECCVLSEVCTTGWSLIQRSPTDCGASLCVLQKPQELDGHDTRWAAAPQEKILSERKRPFEERVFFTSIAQSNLYSQK